jgi:ubiquinol oxidase
MGRGLVGLGDLVPYQHRREHKSLMILMKATLLWLLLLLLCRASGAVVVPARPTSCRTTLPLMAAAPPLTGRGRGGTDSGGGGRSSCDEKEWSPFDEVSAAMNEFLVRSVKGALDIAYTNRDIPRFYVLETIARVPYFSYLSCLHLYESLGMRANVKQMRTHYAEADNELHHLLIMESLGGSAAFADRFVAQHLAFFYYWYCVFVFLVHPRSAYHLSELVEKHAYATYDAFIEDHVNELRAQPVPEVARRYYEDNDAFNAFLLQMKSADDGSGSTFVQRRQPRELRSLYDVFLEVRDDEADHRETLSHLVRFESLEPPDGCEVGSAA